uniref:Peptidase A1 domain-containing protein n=1 Tax=Alexandrium catenella TaxID=2925 RepID=A0A7S1MJZ7_ALECA|mmetsp:Transcript_28339/g.76744  ORF Transcript_28339/g.76744 Transcript_28339/m.76744 type:complete len:559 (+) Transcript_28339:88-1764(+)
MASGLQLLVLVILASLAELGDCRMERAVLHPRSAGLRGTKGEHGKTCTPLVNHGAYFSITVAIGTPPQMFDVVADTGSNTLIVPSCICQAAGKCGKADRCFTGTNRSSTFTVLKGPQGPRSMAITFGSGTIAGVVVKDNAQIGQLKTYMKDGLLLMTDRQLNIAGHFEGILGLGLPLPEQAQQAAGAATASQASAKEDLIREKEDLIRKIMKRIMGGQHARPAAHGGYVQQDAAIPAQNQYLEQASSGLAGQPTGFLEQSHVGRFSMCFNYEGDGVLRLGTPPSASGHGSLSTIHWGLGLWGLSVGKTDAPVQVCLPQDKGPGQKSPCGAIADSGTTFLMGPADHIAALLDTVCDQWDRCARNYSAMVKATRHADEVLVKDYGVNPFRMAPVQKSLIAKLLLMDCDRWLDEADGLDELPPIGFHIRGSNSTEQTLSLPARAYVVQHDVNGSLAAKMNSGIKRICSPSLGAIEYRTADTGPVWILGAPLFYEFNVGYDMLATPPAMAFASVGREPCGGCDKKIGLVATAAESNASRAKWPRIISGPSRLPTSIGVHWPM